LLDVLAGSPAVEPNGGPNGSKTVDTETLSGNGCYTLEVGGRKGWRLLTIEELASLLDLDVQSDLALPPEHPFTVQLRTYWSATTDASNTNFAWRVSLLKDVGEEQIIPVNTGLKSSMGVFAWCVRGGQGIDRGQ
jgi:hypothetical protein